MPGASCPLQFTIAPDWLSHITNKLTISHAHAKNSSLAKLRESNLPRHYPTYDSHTRPATTSSAIKTIPDLILELGTKILGFI